MTLTIPASASPARATVPISYVNTFLSGVAIGPTALTHLLRTAGIAPALLEQTAGRVTDEQFSTLFRGLAAYLDDEMPGLYARPMRGGTLKMLCLVLLDTPTLGAALRRWRQFIRVMGDEMQLEVRREDWLSTITLPRYPRQARSERLVQELQMKLVHGLSSWLVGAPIELEAVDFAFARPPEAAEYVFMFPGAVHFDARRTAMVLRSHYLDLPLRRIGREELRRYLARAPLDWLFMPFENSDSLAHRVRHCLQARPVADVEAVSAALELSPRTMSRRLEAEGTSFLRIKDDLRRDLAVQRLTQTSDSTERIAADLGYAHLSAFHRAFRGWTGGTPAAYRRAI